MSEHEIRRAQAVTRWLEGVKEWVEYHTRGGSVANNRSDVEYVAEHIDELSAIVARLPKTADGVPVVPLEDRIWDWCAMHGGYWEEIPCPPASRSDWIAECYSTREAAEAARMREERLDALDELTRLDQEMGLQ